MSVTTGELPSPAPPVNSETEYYWRSAQDGRLVLPKCDDCGRVIWYPRAICPVCHGSRISWLDAAGTGTVYTFTIVRRTVPPYAAAVPFALAWIELDEGIRMLSNIVDTPLDEIRIGDRVRVVFAPSADGVVLPRFTRADGQ
jgi:hypothetical protein